MVRTAAQVFGWVFVLVGILGFVPGITNDGLLLGIFEVDAIHNIIHLVSGAAALWAASAGPKASKTYFQVFGVIYGIITILGFFAGDDALLGIIAHNTADVWLHLVITLAALYFGFVAKTEEA